MSAGSAPTKMMRRRGSAFSSLEKQQSSSLLVDNGDDGTDTSPEPATPDDDGGCDGDNLLLQVRGKLSALLRKQVQQEKEAQLSTEAYLNRRAMSPMQERMNALTMIPSMLYCAWFLLSGSWWMSSALNNEDGLVAASEESFFGVGCIQSPMFRERVPAMPPMTVIIGAMGGFIHPIFSIIYHWWFATTLESSKRVAHWSRRLDNGFIHFASATSSYATSGRLDYFLVNTLFNFDSAIKHFEEKISPRRNSTRIAVSVLLYLLPMIVYGHLWEFAQFATMFALSGWLFKSYPFGGWSHSL